MTVSHQCIDKFSFDCNGIVSQYKGFAIHVSTWRLYSSGSSIDNMREDEQVRYYNYKHELQTMTFGELKELAARQCKQKGRNLVRVKLSGDKLSYQETTPTFRILLQNELEELVRKNRQHKKQQYFEIIPLSTFIRSEIELDDLEGSDANMRDLVKPGRIRQKQLQIKVGIGDHDLQAATNRISKWLSGGRTFVIVTITSNDKKVEGKALEMSLRAKLEKAEGILNLTVKIV